ncbi:hypothetical protein PHYSODRAFT_300026 [Phytophthora sojae]|uniref:Uncharacterized protein n=1 Tax=Phytophthora sojae (strain P6497) TaxID=1094619 RepID=G4ZFW5_PHYSP|nr:hypothetical protein PHYSODRAFT_300026 [Phytophthora sojae]EGZ16649.1 hypothetical protein PHYSODRAFT_300026 [Phytophthora sojae]|eukprot:XP_009525707.1 hypothetical protein PHYSODRAFT_300026 [Phytophthora sojae]
MEAAKRGDLGTFRWIMEHFSGCTVSEDVASEVCRRGHRDILEYLLEYEKGVQCPSIQYGHRHVVRSLREPTGMLMAAAAAGGHNELVLWMSSIDRFEPTNKYEVLVEVARHGDLDLLKRLLEMWRRQQPRPPGLDYAAQGGNVEMMKWLKDKCGIIDSTGKRGALTEAARKGHVEVARWLAENYFSDQEREALTQAAGNGHLAMVEWLLGNAHARTTEAFAKAVKNGHFEVAQCLHRHGLAMFTPLIMYETAKNGDLVMIQWLREAFAHKPRLDIFQTDRNRRSMMDAAAERGHLHVMKYLHEIARSRKNTKTVVGKRKRQSSTPEPQFSIPECTENTMALAVGHGHVHVVEWIQANYELKPNVNSMDKAAERGHLEMLKWLDQNTDCKCTISAFNVAARRGHFRVIRWLHSNQPECCKLMAMTMDPAASVGNLRLVKWLRKNCIEGGTYSAMTAAAREGL